MYQKQHMVLNGYTNLNKTYYLPFTPTYVLSAQYLLTNKTIEHANFKFK
jgi:hypothetical protein